MSRIRVPGIIRMLYTHNPFYLISAVLFLYGLQLLFRPGRIDLIFSRGDVAYIDPWWLTMSLCGVTLLMALTAFLSSVWAKSGKTPAHWCLCCCSCFWRSRSALTKS